MGTISFDQFEESLEELREIQQNYLQHKQEGDITIPQETALCLLSIIDLFAKSKYKSLDPSNKLEMLHKASKFLKHKALNFNSKLNEDDIFCILSKIVTDF